MIGLKFKLEYAPIYKTEASAGADIKSRVDIVIPANNVVMVPTGVYIDYWIPIGKRIPYLDVRIRSSLAAKRGLTLANGAGVIDADYKDMLKLITPITDKINIKESEIDLAECEGGMCPIK